MDGVGKWRMSARCKVEFEHANKGELKRQHRCNEAAARIYTVIQKKFFFQS